MNNSAGRLVKMSHGQRALWYLNQLEPASTAYHLNLCLKLTGRIDEAALSAAWQAVGLAHPQLRARFAVHQEEPAAIVDSSFSPLKIKDGGVQNIGEAWNETVKRPIDLELENPLRGMLFRDSDGTAHLMMCLHHIAGDLYSCVTILNELSQCYAAIAATGAAPARKEDTNFERFVTDESHWLNGPHGAVAWDFWSEYLKTAKTEPFGRASASIETPGEVVVTLDPTTSNLVRTVARQQGITPYTVLLAGYATLLGERDDSNEIIIGTPASLRDSASLRSTVGYLVNTVPIRCRLRGGQAEKVEAINGSSRKALKHRRFPFSTLVERMRLPRRAGAALLIQATFTYYSLPAQNRIYLPFALGAKGTRWEFGGGITAEATSQPAVDPQFPIALTLGCHTDSFSGTIQYDGCHVSRDEALRLAARFPSCVREMLAGKKPAPHPPVLGKPAERLEELFDETAHRQPDAIAASEHGLDLTYSQMKARAETYARGLNALLEGDDRPVALQLESSLDAAVAIIGILKSGRPFVPIDTGEPPARIRAMLIKTGAGAFISKSQTSPASLPEGIKSLTLDSIQTATSRRIRSHSRSNIAYIIFTSGTTGEPKAVEIGHAAILNHARAIARLFRLVPEDRILQFHTLAFDAAFEELFPTWAAGARNVFEPNSRQLSVPAFLELVDASGVTTLNLPTSYWHMLTEEATRLRLQPAQSLRLVVVGGEQASAKAYANWRKLAPHCHWINTYGPTETTVTALAYEPPTNAEFTGGVPIGWPIAGVEAFVLNSTGEFVDAGEGELFIGGAGLALGYRGDANGAGARFAARSVNGEKRRLYRTGDRVNLRDDGTYEYLGRFDRQLKIRGYRVDPEEIELALRQHAGIADATVFPIVQEIDPLLACRIVRTDPALTARNVREHLSARLPDYMVPSRFKFVKHLPRKSNGKLDLRAVPRTVRQSAHGEAALQEMAAIFSELLDGKTGPRDDFFLRGGHSLMAIKLLGRVEAHFGARIPLADFLATPTPIGLLKALKPALVKPAIVPQPVPLAESPVSAEQRRALSGHEIGKASLANIVLVMRIRGQLNPNILRRAWDKVIQDNPILRCGFNRNENEIVIRDARKFPAMEFHEAADSDLPRAVTHFANAEAKKPFNMDGESPWVRPLFISTPKQEQNFLILITHHALMDGWAASLLLEDLCDAHTRITSGSINGTIRRTDYQLYASAQPNWLESERAKAMAAFWKTHLSGAGDIHLPFGRPATDDLSWTVQRHEAVLSKAVSQKLRKAAKTCGVSAFAFSMAAFKALLYRHTGQTDITLGTMVSNRTDSEHAMLLGPLQNPVLIRNQFDPRSSFHALARAVAHSISLAQDNGLLPFEKAIQASGYRAGSAHFSSQIQFLSHEAVVKKLRLGHAKLESIDVPAGESPFALTVAATTATSRIRFVFEHQTAAFSASGIQQVARQFTTLLAAAATEPGQQASKLPMLSKVETRRFRQRTAKSHKPAVELLHTGFEAQTHANPDAPAVVAEHMRLTYGELHTAAEALAAKLIANGIKPGGPVAIMLPKSRQQIVACLGVMKAGGAYVPIDPGLPRARLDAIFNQGGFHLGIAAEETSAAYLRSKGICTISISAPADAVADNLKIVLPQPHLPAYVIFTSGTTGVPKGVVTSHESAMTTIAEISRRFTLSPKDRVLAISELGFDLSVFDIFGILRAGGTLVLPADRDPRTWMEQLEKDGITVWNSVPCLFDLLLNEIESNPHRANCLRLILLSGDFVPTSLARRAMALFPQARIVSLGGATEAGIWSIAHEIKEISPHWRSVPYGRPLRNQEMFVLDDELNHCAIGVSGELFIAGAALAQGYWRNPAETRHRFFSHPRWKVRLYRTGDRGRYIEDGEIEILGRIDAQCKINGVRVELGEVETLVSALPGVRQAVAGVRPDPTGNNRLVAFVTAEPGTEISHLFSQAKKIIPPALCPTAFHILSQFPLTTNGKINRAAVVKITPQMAAPLTEAARPQSTSEQWIAALWSELLGIASTGLDDDFFALGGHSLLAIRMLQRLRSHFGIQLPIATILNTPTVRTLAAAVENAAKIRLQPALTHRPLAEFSAELDPRIHNFAPPPTRPRPGILLSGATGHLGSALLAELLLKTTDSIHCLVRASTPSEALERIRQSLQSHGTRNIPAERIIPIPADLTHEQFGLKASAFNNLATQVHAIYHCAAEVNFIAPYEKLAAANVEAVRQMVQLSAIGGATLHHISSVAVFPYGGTDRHFEDEDISNIESLMGGYAQSKWVAERLISNAMSKGLRAVIYRPAQIVPRPHTGDPHDLFEHIARTCQVLRAIPDIDTKIDMVTPEFAASAIRVISTKPSSLGKVFHLVHPAPIKLRDAAAHGTSLALIPFSEWRQRLHQQAAMQDDPSVQFVSMLADGLDRHEVTPPDFDCSRTIAALQKSGIACPPIEPNIFRNLVNYST